MRFLQSAGIGLIIGWTVPTSLAVANRMLIYPLTAYDYITKLHPDVQESIESLRHPTFLEALWQRNYLDEHNYYVEKVLKSRLRGTMNLDFT